jgi:hypothetical protein
LKPLGIDMKATLADIVCNQGTSAIECDCGTMWFTHEAEGIDDLRASADANPEMYREMSDDDGIAFGEIEGRIVVWGCPKCMAKLDRRESWIKDNEEVIREFLKRFGQERLAEAQRLAAIE